MGRINLTMSNTDQTSNTIAALASFFIPGLGQLVQGRAAAGILFFVADGVAWLLALFTVFLLIPLPIIVTIWAVLNAAKYKPSS